MIENLQKFEQYRMSINACEQTFHVLQFQIYPFILVIYRVLLLELCAIL